MAHARTLVIVPRLPPSIDGVGDYALTLLTQLRVQTSSSYTFLVCDPKWTGPSSLEGFEVLQLKCRSRDAFLDKIKSFDQLFLHYVGYGYAKRGCPGWLLAGMKAWKATGKKRLVTFFHELYAFGPAWSSQFWTSPYQRWLAAKLACLSDRVATSKQDYAKRLGVLSLGKHQNILCLPVFSNVGEPPSNPCLREREPTLVIFGSPGPRRRSYLSSLDGIKQVCEVLRITKILDIGARTEECPSMIGNIQVESLGPLPKEKISEIFSRATAGFVAYPPFFLAKSGIFASYCSHGLVPVVSWHENQEEDSVIEGKDYWRVGATPHLNMELAQKLSENAFKWYQGHSLGVQAKVIQSLL